MAAANKDRWRGNLYGATEPMIQRFKVAAGSSQAIKMGEICKIDASDDNVTIVTGTTDNLHALLVAAEEQESGDSARFMKFYVPRPGDFFEFDLDSATAVKWGDELQIHSSDSTFTLAVSTTDAVAWAVNVNTPDSGTTWPTVSVVYAMFQKASKAAAGKELPLIGDLVGDGA